MARYDAMTASRPSPPPPAPSLAWFLTVMTVVYAVLDIGIAVVFGPFVLDDPHPEERAAFGLLVVSALAGVPLVVVVAVAAARIARRVPGARRLAGAAVRWAGLRIVAVTVAFAVLAVVVGVRAMTSTLPLVFLGVTLFDALAAWYIASRVKSRTPA